LLNMLCDTPVVFSSSRITGVTLAKPCRFLAALVSGQSEAATEFRLKCSTLSTVTACGKALSDNISQNSTAGVSFCVSGVFIRPQPLSLMGLLFLFKKFEDGWSFSSLNQARAALNSVFNRLLTYLRGLWPHEGLDLLTLTVKTAALLALCSAQRVQTLQCLSVDTMQLTTDCATFIFRRPLKTSAPHRLPAFDLLAFKADRAICPLRCLRDYLRRTADIRQVTVKQPLLSTRRPHGAASANSSVKVDSQSPAGCWRSRECPHDTGCCHLEGSSSSSRRRLRRHFRPERTENPSQLSGAFIESMPMPACIASALHNFLLCGMQNLNLSVRFLIFSAGAATFR
jgi:hypothetical protein